MQATDDEPIVAFTLAHYPRRTCLLGMAHLGLDRLPLVYTPGLRFWRLLGVGRGHVFDPHPDWQRYGLFTVWESSAALKRFEQASAVMQRIRRRADEVWSVQMRPVRWHGRWGGCDPFGGIPPAEAPEPGPWIILTRAAIYPHKVAAFLRAVPAVSELLLQQPELINSLGIGEAPLLFQATLSLWHTLPAVKGFAYASPAHAEVIKRTRREGWYREELFARFRPIASQGTWDGVNPLPQLS